MVHGHGYGVDTVADTDTVADMDIVMKELGYEKR